MKFLQSFIKDANLIKIQSTHYAIDFLFFNNAHFQLIRLLKIVINQ